MDFALREFTDTFHHVLVLRVDGILGAQGTGQRSLERIFGDTGDPAGRLGRFEGGNVH